MSSNARCVQLSEELGENIKELQSLEEDQTESRAEIKKVTWLCSRGVGWHWWSELIPVCHVPQQWGQGRAAVQAGICWKPGAHLSEEGFRGHLFAGV